MMLLHSIGCSVTVVLLGLLHALHFFTGYGPIFAHLRFVLTAPVT
jgi:hypothetical protein